MSLESLRARVNANSHLGKEILKDYLPQASSLVEASLKTVENAKLGDYVIAHSGFALTLLDVEEAEKTLSVWREYKEIMGES